jgi:hypothetical protein
MDDLFADDGFLAPPPSSQPESPVTVEEPAPEVVIAAPSPTSAASPGSETNTAESKEAIASPVSQNGNKVASAPMSASASPARSPTANGDEGAVFVSGSASLKERGAQKVKKQLADIAARTAAQDAASIKKDKETKAAAAAYLKELVTKREQTINATKADHMKEQQEYERKMKDLKTSGKLWDSVNLLVDGKKPNPYSKNTEYMRGLLVGMSAEGAAAKA